MLYILKQAALLALMMKFTNTQPLRARAGFTLIELVLVTAIVLILIGLSTPLFKRTFSDLVIKDLAFNVSKLIDYAREKAILQRKNFKISFDFPSGRYRLLEIDDTIEPPVYKRVAGKFGRGFALPKGMLFKGPRNEIIFYPDGHCDETDIDILDGKGSGYTVLIKGLGSRIEIKGPMNER